MRVVPSLLLFCVCVLSLSVVQSRRLFASPGSHVRVSVSVDSESEISHSFSQNPNALSAAASSALSSTPVSSPFTLACNLLSASRVTYEVDGSGNFHPGQPEMGASSWDTNPGVRVFSAGPQKIDSCIVGSSTSLGAVIVAFRGTEDLSWSDLFTSILDWTKDFDFYPITQPSFAQGAAVHSGFWQAVDSLWSDILPAIQSLMSPGMKLYITGHSKGGAMASITAYRLVTEASITPTAVYTFASPRPGNAAWVNSFPSSVPVYRYEVSEDLIPLVPPNIKDVADKLINFPIIGEMFTSLKTSQYVEYGDYTPLGTLRFITEDKQILTADPDPSETEEVIDENLALGIVGVGNLLRYHIAHCPSLLVPGDYVTAVCPTLC